MALIPGIVMYSLGNLALRQHDYATAGAMYEGGLVCKREVGSLYGGF